VKTTVLILLAVLQATLASAQITFKTVVPQQPVVEGESFRVQYVAENTSDVSNFLTPSFKGFRVVNGPENYQGKTGFGAGSRQLYNTVYTLQAIKPGHFQIAGAVATIDDKLSRSNDMWIEVISRADAEQLRKQADPAIDDPSYLRPGEDAYQKIKQNLFIKVMVSKRSCYPGEPVVATFKLFSRLESSSDIVKNPGFYGFTIYDMVNLADKEKAVETVNGKLFDVHTIRKVQLYPLQAGSYSIDPMEIRNRVEFSRSSVNRKTEQKIIEGVFENDDYVPGPDKEVFESDMSTEPIIIDVKPIAAKNKPSGFNGAVGDFTIEAAVEKNELAKNEEGFFIVTIRGKGNFTQLSAPAFNWPAGMEGFEPAVTDSLDKTAVPLSGTRSFRYAFTSGKPGVYELPAVDFEYYDVDSNRYKRSTTQPVKLTISTKEKITTPVEEKKIAISTINKRVSLIAGSIIVLLVITTLIYWGTRKKEIKKETVPEQAEKPRLSVEELLKPAQIMVPAADADFYKALQQSLWLFIGQQFTLQGSAMNKQSVAVLLKQSGIPGEMTKKLLELLTQCEMGVFTHAELGADKESIVEDAWKTLLGIAMLTAK
jgi:hypothetical protein